MATRAKVTASCLALAKWQTVPLIASGIALSTGDAGGLGPQSVGSRRMGVDQLNRYGLRDLLRMLRVSDDRA